MKKDQIKKTNEGKDSGSFQKILKVALELNVDFDSIDGNIISKMLEEVPIIIKKTKDMKEDIMYTWYFAEKTQKLAIFEHITKYKADANDVQLKQSGT